MTDIIPRQRTTLEVEKFLLDANGDICVRTCITEGDITSTPIGLGVAGEFKEITINPTTWTLLTTSLSSRNLLAIQNATGEEIKVNFAEPATFLGWIVPDGGEKFYNIAKGVSLFAKSKTTAGLKLGIEEIA